MAGGNRIEGIQMVPVGKSSLFIVQKFPAVLPQGEGLFRVWGLTPGFIPLIAGLLNLHEGGFGLKKGRELAPPGSVDFRHPRHGYTLPRHFRAGPRAAPRFLCLLFVSFPHRRESRAGGNHNTPTKPKNMKTKSILALAATSHLAAQTTYTWDHMDSPTNGGTAIASPLTTGATGADVTGQTFGTGF